jgi:hypothetical protein
MSETKQSWFKNTLSGLFNKRTVITTTVGVGAVLLVGATDYALADTSIDLMSDVTHIFNNASGHLNEALDFAKDLFSSIIEDSSEFVPQTNGNDAEIITAAEETTITAAEGDGFTETVFVDEPKTYVFGGEETTTHVFTGESKTSIAGGETTTYTYTAPFEPPVDVITTETVDVEVAVEPEPLAIETLPIVVESGDTALGIAFDLYGVPLCDTEFYAVALEGMQANSDVANVHKIYPGDVLNYTPKEVVLASMDLPHDAVNNIYGEQAKVFTPEELTSFEPPSEPCNDNRAPLTPALALAS